MSKRLAVIFSGSRPDRRSVGLSRRCDTDSGRTCREAMLWSSPRCAGGSRRAGERRRDRGEGREQQDCRGIDLRGVRLRRVQPLPSGVDHKSRDGVPQDAAKPKRPLLHQRAFQPEDHRHRRYAWWNGDDFRTDQRFTSIRNILADCASPAPLPVQGGQRDVEGHV